MLKAKLIYFELSSIACLDLYVVGLLFSSLPFLRSKICVSKFEILVTDDVLHFCWKYTFILPASKGLPKQCVKYGAAAKYAVRKDVGIRIPDDAICQAILGKLDSPLISTRLIQAKFILCHMLFNSSCFINNLYTTIFQCQMA